MKFKNIKDRYFRNLFHKDENFIKALKIVKTCCSSSPELITKNVNYGMYYNNFNQYVNMSKVKLKHRCILTTRGRGIVKKYGLSRNILKEYLRLGYIPGHKKAVW